MTTKTLPVRRRLELRTVIGLVLLLWLAYTAVQTLFVTGHLSDGWAAALSFAPGLIAVGVLRSAGLSRQALYLRLASLSRPGLAILVLVFVFSLAAVLPFGEWQGWSWMAALVLAPASGVAQELFFRSALFPAMEQAFQGRPRRALLAHSLLFGLWHIGPLFLGAPMGAVVAIMAVPFLAGLGWGWQVRRDETVGWAMVQHSLIWVIGLQFAFPA